MLKDKHGANLKDGDRVRVIIRGSPRANIQHEMTDIPGGVILDRQIDGTVYWNSKDLVKI